MAGYKEKKKREDFQGRVPMNLGRVGKPRDTMKLIDQYKSR